MNATTTAYAAKGFLGRTEDGDCVWIEIELRNVDRPSRTTEHETVQGYTELSITGAMADKGRAVADSWGQITDDAARVVKPAKGITADDIARLAEIWEAWHLNGMQAGCAHQEVIWEDSTYGRRPSLTLTEPCPAQAADENVKQPYRYGTAWLIKALPAEVEQWVREFGDKLDGEQARG